MSDLLEKMKNKTEKPYKPIKTGASIEFNNLLTKEDISPKSIDVETSKPPSTRDVFVSMRITQGFRNTVQGLGLLGYGETLLETMEYVMNTFLETLSDDEIKKLNGFQEFYDKADLMKQDKKTANKANKKK